MDLIEFDSSTYPFVAGCLYAVLPVTNGKNITDLVQQAKDDVPD